MSDTLSHDEIEKRRDTAALVYQTGAGRDFINSLLDDLGLYDIPATESEMVLHNFALVVLKRYFGATVNDRDHRSFVTEAIIEARKPLKET